MLQTTYPIGAIRDNLNFVIVCASMTVVASIAVGLRLWSRRLCKVGYGVDDYLIVISLFTTYLLFILVVMDVNLGMGRDMSDMPKENLTIILKLVIAYQILYATAMATLKLSFLTFFCRIFEVQEEFSKKAYILMVIVVSWWVGNTLQVFLVCMPFDYNWNPEKRGGHCGNRQLAYVLIAGFNILTDIAIWVLPVHQIIRLQMPTKRRWAIVLVLKVGLVVTATSVARLVVLSRLSFTNITRDMLDSVCWSVIEPTVAITNACLPMFRRPVVEIGQWIPSYCKPSDRRRAGSFPIQSQEDHVNESRICLQPLGDDQSVSTTYSAKKDDRSSITIVHGSFSTQNLEDDKDGRIRLNNTSAVTYEV